MPVDHRAGPAPAVRSSARAPRNTPTGRPVAVVTGGCGDIGSAVGVALAASGYAVVLADVVPEDRGEAVAKEVADRAAVAAEHVSAARLDVTDQAATTALVDSLPRLDVVVANAGTVQAQPFLEIDLEAWHRQLDVNLTGAFVTAQAGARRMVREGVRGLVLFTSSWVASRPWPGISAYAASKAGLDQLMRQIALELSPHGVRANAVAPGIVRAGLAKQQLEMEPDYVARVATAVPLGELQTADDVAGAVAFLASPAAATMDGAVLVLDGGSSLGAMT